MRPGLRPDFEKPILADRPLVGNIESVLGMRADIGQDAGRDETILSHLRRRLSDRKPGNFPVTGGRRASDKKSVSVEDKYEQQRINRKICWQYDQSAKKVPLLRRNYI